jgi:hypothetical protein
VKSHYLSSICTRPVTIPCKMGRYYTPRPTAAWPLQVTVGLITAARPPTVNIGFPKGGTSDSQHTKSAPNGSTSALNNLSTSIGGGSASSDCNFSNSGGSTLGNLRAISRVVYPFPLILALPASVWMPPVALGLLRAASPPLVV